MSLLSFVHVQPGKKATAASKHQQRVGIHSHAQKITQQRKREKRLQDIENKPKAANAIVKNSSPNKSALFQQLAGSHDVGILVRTVGPASKYPHGIPTPSPEPDMQITRLLTDYSSWTQDHKYGVSMFIHVTTLDINETATNMTFWRQDVPALSTIWACIRDIVSAIAAANQAIQDRDSDLIMTALELHLKALAALRRDVAKMPLSAQVACCLLFDAFNLLRCEFAQAGDQIAVARKLTSDLQIDAYLQDEMLPTVCDVLSRMNETSAWSFWKPSNFLRYEGLRHVEPSLRLELQPSNYTNGVLQGLVESIGRLSRQFSGRIRRNLSENAYIDPSSRLAHDVLRELQLWKARFDSYIAQNDSYEERATIQQAELGWSFFNITFTGGVLHGGEMIYDDVRFAVHYHRICELAQKRFSESADFSRHNSIKPFLQIILPSLWLLILMCRDPAVRAQSISILQSRHYQEGEFNSKVTAKMAEAIVTLETAGLHVNEARDVPLHRRIRVEGLRYRVETEEVVLSYSFLSHHGSQAPQYETCIPWKPEGNLVKLNSSLAALSQTCTLYRKVRPSDAVAGCIKPMYYRNELVPICLTWPYT